MGIPLPAELQAVLGLVGLPWPSTDEAAVLAQGQDWFDLARRAAHEHEDAIGAVATMTTSNIGLGIDAFVEAWRGIAGGDGVLRTHQLLALSQADAGLLVASAVTTCKLSEIAYLGGAVVILETAIAGAAETYGASLLAAAQQLALIQTLVKGVIEVSVGIIRAISLVQGELVPTLHHGSARIANRAIHRGPDSTTRNAGDLSRRLASAQEAPRGDKTRPRAFPGRAAPNSILVRHNRTTGEISAYAEYGPDGAIKKRVDLTEASRPHFEKSTQQSVPPPHVVEYTKHVSPTGQVKMEPGPTRPADPEEIP